MTIIHFRKFLGLTSEAYGKPGARKKLFLQLQDAQLTKDSTSDRFNKLLEKVKAHAVASSKAEGRPYVFDNSDSDLLTSFRKNKGSREKAAAFHFYFLSNEAYDVYAKALNEEISLQAIMGDEFESAEFTFHFDQTESSDGPSVHSSADQKPTVETPSLPEAPSPNAIDLPLWFPPIQALKPDRSNWLSPYVADALPFEGREAELRRLHDFADAEPRFLLWALAGPAGVGKTRLAVEWMRQSQYKIFQGDVPWTVGFLTRDAVKSWKTQGGNWSSWVPQSPTIIVADYLHLFGPEVVDIFQRFAGLGGSITPEFPVRVLLVDHVITPSLRELYRDPRLPGLSSGGSSGHVQTDAFFDDLPLQLTPASSSNDMLQALVSAAAQVHGEVPTKFSVANATETLARMPSAALPLFAALIGQGISIGEGELVTSRRDLIENYLTSVERLPWKALRDRPPLGDIAACIVSASTIVGGASIYSLMSGLDVAVEADDAEFVTSFAEYLVGSRSHDLVPMTPDLLAETFFLLFIERALHSKPLLKTFIGLFSYLVSDEDIALRCVAFFNRVIQNLVLDDIALQKRYLILLGDLFDSGTQATGALCQVLAISQMSLMNSAPDAFHHVPDRLLRSVKFLGQSTAPILAITGAEQMVQLFEKELRSSGNENGAANLSRYLSHFSDDESWGQAAPILPLHMAASLDLPLAAAELAAARPNLIDRVDYLGNTALTNACRNGNLDVAVKLIEAGADVNKPDAEGHTPLLLAVSHNRREVAKYLMALPAVKVHSCCEHGSTPLYLSAMAGDEELVTTLLRRDAQIDFMSPVSGDTALMVACERGHLNLVKLLVGLKANPNLARPDGGTALTFAIKNLRTAVVGFLLSLNEKLDLSCGAPPLMVAIQVADRGVLGVLLTRPDVDLNGTAHPGWQSPICAACLHSDEKLVQQLLLHDKIDPNQLAQDGTRALYYAIGNKNRAVLRHLLADARVDPNLPVFGEETALTVTVQNRNMWATKELLGRADIDVNRPGRGSTTPFKFASIIGDTKIARLFADRAETDVNAPSFDGFTPLMSACELGHLGILKILATRSDVDYARHSTVGITAAAYAVTKGKVDCLAFLMSRKLVDLNEPMQDGLTLASLAAAFGDTSALRLLLGHAELDINAVRSDTRNPLLTAIIEKQPESVKTILRRTDLDVNVRTIDGFTPLLLAAGGELPEIVRLLVRDGRANLDAAEPNFGFSPLMLSARMGDEVSAKILIASRRIDFALLSRSGHTALEIALSSGHDQIADLISEASGIGYVRLNSDKYYIASV